MKKMDTVRPSQPTEPRDATNSEYQHEIHEQMDRAQWVGGQLLNENPVIKVQEADWMNDSGVLTIYKPKGK